jgi:hypothetical protein
MFGKYIPLLRSGDFDFSGEESWFEFDAMAFEILQLACLPAVLGRVNPNLKP